MLKDHSRLKLLAGDWDEKVGRQSERTLRDFPSGGRRRRFLCYAVDDATEETCWTSRGKVKRRGSKRGNIRNGNRRAGSRERERERERERRGFVSAVMTGNGKAADDEDDAVWSRCISN